jgi:hypothetical protein
VTTKKRAGVITPQPAPNAQTPPTEAKSILQPGGDNSPDENVVLFRGLGWLEYQEARRQLREYNAKRRARRGGGR